MEFKKILNRHLSAYVASGASLTSRIGFLVCLFMEMKESDLDLNDHKKDVLNSLKIKFFHKSLDDLYEICVLRDIEKAISLVGPSSQKTNKTPDPVIEEKVEVKAVVNVDTDPDRDAIKNRKEQVDFEFLLSLGTDLEYLKSLGYKE